MYTLSDSKTSVRQSSELFIYFSLYTLKPKAYTPLCKVISFIGSNPQRLSELVVIITKLAISTYDFEMITFLFYFSILMVQSGPEE